jgi:hypothetical protein
MRRNSLKKIFIFLSILILILLALFYKSESAIVETRHLDVSHCLIMQDSCEIELGDSGKLILDISPKGMPTTKPAFIKVSLKGLDANLIKVGFSSVDLDYKTPVLTLNKINDQSFNGRVFLSLCTIEKTKWTVDLNIYAKGVIWNIDIPFIHSGDQYNIIKPSS